MQIPPLENGHLPPGEYSCLLTDVEAAFCPPDNEHRRRLFAGLVEYLARVKATAVFDHAYVDGSFATEKPVPQDVDVVLYSELSGGVALSRLDSQGALLLLSGKVRDDYGVHVMTSYPEDRRSLERFQQVRAAELLRHGLSAGFRKGILRVSLL